MSIGTTARRAAVVAAADALSLAFTAPAGAETNRSLGTNTLSQCTFAIGWVRGEEIEGHTEVRC